MWYLNAWQSVIVVSLLVGYIVVLVRGAYFK